MKRNALTLEDIARLGLWLDDPHGDGIRLERIRNPNPGRLAALDYVNNGHLTQSGECAIRYEYEARVLDHKNWRKDGTLVAAIRRNFAA